MNKMILRFITCILLIPCVNFAESAERGPNILMICIDDLRNELNSFGRPYIHSPNIDKLTEEGRAFHNHYATAPSCGPSRYSMLTGLHPLPVGGNEHFLDRTKRLRADPISVPPSMPEWFKERGYTTVSVGKVSHFPGGRGGSNWDNEKKLELPNAWDLHIMPSGEWQHPRGAMHGYANGKQRAKSNKDNYAFEAVKGPNSIYPDGRITEEGLKLLETLSIADQPFFLAIGLIKPHLPFAAPKRYLDLYEGVKLPKIDDPKKIETDSWHGSREFMGYQRWGKNPNLNADFANEVRRHYAACVSYVDDHVGKILAKLEETGEDKNTIVVLWGDHGWHLGEHGIWGKHCLLEEALKSPLIIRYPHMLKPGKASDSIVSSIDIFPTLCALTGIEPPTFTQGVSLLPILEEPKTAGSPAFSHHGSSVSVRTKTHRLILHKKGAPELYDHGALYRDEVNIATESPKLVETLKSLIQ